MSASVFLVHLHVMGAQCLEGATKLLSLFSFCPRLWSQYLVFHAVRRCYHRWKPSCPCVLYSPYHLESISHITTSSLPLFLLLHILLFTHSWITISLISLFTFYCRCHHPWFNLFFFLLVSPLFFSPYISYPFMYPCHVNNWWSLFGSLCVVRSPEDNINVS